MCNRHTIHIPQIYTHSNSSTTFHMVLVCSPILLVPEMVWQQFAVPTLEGQYIIKNAVVIAVAIGIAASAKPLTHRG